jgi:hypothetical protein
MKSFTLTLCLAAIAAVGCKKHAAASDMDTILPGRHMSEHQVIDIARRELPVGVPFRCEFTNSAWEILEIQKETNANGKVIITPTSATRVVFRVRDIDGKVEQVEMP